ncbi:MAG: DegT/DnrJ/EryC1/StrS family aminotransferase [Rubricoccaceae bacterium]|nr:DegT/DnrJ/EryC1/StrS family aminotransferase [Rubricoccaceae bacterium]
MSLTNGTPAATADLHDAPPADPSPVPILDLTPEIEMLWDEFNQAFQDVLRSGQFIMGPAVKAFEAAVADYLGCKHAIGVNSGTDALVIGLRALGIGPGDEVITTPFSFFATAESISNVGATPVFADIDEATFNLDPAAVEAKITPRTKAIMPVHLFGDAADMGALLQIAEAHGLRVVEDCAQSFGARYVGDGEASGAFTGTMGDVGAFSFFPSKNLGAFGDGGLIVTDDDAVADAAAMLRKHGARKKYHNETLGYNSRLDALQAALLHVKLPHIDRFNAGRRRVAALYNERLADVPGVQTPRMTDGHVFHQYTVRVLDGRRDALREHLQREGISTMVYYPIPQDRLPVYDGTYPENPVSDRLSAEVLSLPIWPSMEEAVVERVVAAIRRALGA